MKAVDLREKSVADLREELLVLRREQLTLTWRKLRASLHRFTCWDKSVVILHGLRL